MTRRVQDELRASGEIGRDFINGISTNSSVVAVNNHSNNNSATPRDKNKNSRNDCNSQICSSYVVGLLSCLLIIGGVFLAFQRWDYMWLVVTLVGIVLTFVGASLHYCGTQENSRHHGGNSVDGSVRQEVSQSERLLSPSAPSLGTFSTSQLSLSTLPPYFPSYDALSLVNGGPPPLSSDSSVGNGGAISPIMRINGQSFLLLPIGGRIDEETDAQSQIFANKIANVSTLQLNREPNENSNEQRRGPVTIKPRDSQAPPVSTVNQTRSDIESTSSVTSPEPSSPSVSQSTQTCTVEIQTVPEVSTSAVIPRTVATETNSEPIYEVPRLISEPEVISERVIEDVDIPADTVTSRGTDETMAEPINPELAIPIVIDLDGQSRANSPDRDNFSEDILSPPSYDEVTTVATTLRLGMPKFAYETM